MSTKPESDVVRYAAVALVWCSGGHAALAQAQSSMAPASDEAQISGLEEIVVTARKRVEPIQSVPISIAAFSATDLEERGVKMLGDVARFTPGVVIDQGASASGGNHSTSIYVRGLGQSDPSGFADPAVALYIDGVYFGRSVGSMQDIVDLQRIEILKGPQGTLFGKNTMGGAISIVSAMPTGEFKGSAEATVGRFDQREFKGSVEFPIVTDALAAKLSISSRQRNGYTTSLITGQEQDDIDSLVGRGIVRWTPSSDVSVAVIGDYTRVREAAQGFHLITTGLNPAAPPGGALAVYNVLPFAAPSTPYEAFDDRWISASTDHNYSTGLIGFCNCSSIDGAGFSATLDWSVGEDVTVTAISAYRKQESSNAVDLDSSPLDFQANGNSSEQHQFSEEVRVNGSSFDDRLEWLVGAYFMEEEIDEILHVRIGFAGAFQALSLDNHVWPRTQTRGLFTQETVELTDKLSITGGIRYNYEKKRVPAQSLNLLTNNFLLPPTTKQDEWESWTPKASIEYQATPDALLYASYSEGFKSGGYDYLISQNAFLPYGPEEVKAYEVGFKTEWLGRRLRLNGAVFYNDYTDLQLRASILPGTFNCPATVLPECSSIVNASAVRITGAELELTAHPLERLEIFASAGYTKQKFTDIDPVLLASNATNPGTGANFDSKLPRTPEWSSAFGAQYTLPVGSYGDLILRADYSYQSLVYFELADSRRFAQEGYGLLSARAALVSADEHWQLALEGKNLTDERYITTALTVAAFNYAVEHYGAPRTWAASLAYRF